MRIRQGNLFVGAITSALMFCSAAQAQVKGNLFTFGDSFLDVGNTGGFPGGVGPSASNHFNTPEQFSMLANYNLVGGGINGVFGATDFAVGGTGVIPGPPGINYLTQIQDYSAAVQAGLSPALRPNDLILIASGQNEQVQFVTGPAIALQTATNMAKGVQQLIGMGGRNFVVWGGIPADRLGLPPGVPPGGDFLGFQTTLQTALPADLAPLAAPGVQIRYLNIYVLYSRIIDTPQMYGFLPGPCPFTVCPGAPLSQQDLYATYFAHPTNAFSLVLAKYINNLLHAQDELPAQADVAQGTAMQFSDSLFGRMDQYRSFGSYGLGRSNAMAYAAMSYAPEKKMPFKAAAPVAFQPIWAAYIDGGYAQGNRDAVATNPGGQMRAYDYSLPNGKAGLEYLINPDLRIGGAVGYAKASVNFNNTIALTGGHMDVSTPQIAGYASYTRSNWFTDAVVTYGHNDYNISRPGVIDILNGKTSGDSFTAAFKSAYLFDAGMLRVGPIGGLQFAHSNVNSYTETGDSVLTQMVQGQSVNTLIGSAGVQFRTPFLANNVVYSPYLNVTAEHDFIGNGRTIIAAQTDALVLPIYTVIPNVDRTYGKVAGGLAAELPNQFSLTLAGSSTFARTGGNDYSVSGGLRKTF